MERFNYNQLGRFGKLRVKFDLGTTGRLLVCALLVGILAGLFASGFYLALQGVQTGVRSLYAFAGIRFEPPPTPEQKDEPPLTITEGRVGASQRTDILFGMIQVPRYWLLILLIPSFGGLLCGIIVFSFAGEAAKEGTDSIIKAFHFRNGIIRFRLLIVKSLSAIATLGSGGSAGWESPTALVGAGAGSLFCRMLKTNAQERRLLLLAGTAGGISAIFQIPIGGTLFAVEILYCTLAVEFGAFFPCLIASLAGYSTFRGLIGTSMPMHLTEKISFETGSLLWIHLPFYLLFALLCAGIGWLFVRSVHEIHNRFFRRLDVLNFVKPAIGGLLLGIVAIFFPQVFGGGYEWIAPTIEGRLSFGLMAALVLAKILASTLTVASGGSGGLLGPSIFIGAMLGGSAGTGLKLLLETAGLSELVPAPATFVVLGMAAFYGGIGKVPLAAAVMTCEIVGLSYYWTIPMLVMTLLHFAIQSPRTSLYEEQVSTPLDSPAHFGDFVVEILQVKNVKDVTTLDLSTSPPNTALIPESATLPEMMRSIAASTNTFFPVVDSDRHLIGLLSLGDVRSSFVSFGDWRLIVAADLAQLPDMYALPEDTIFTVLRILHRGGIDGIPVIDSPKTRRVIGFISRHEIVAAYNDSISRYRDPQSLH